MRLHIIRHGDPNYELDALTQLGRKDAKALAKRMAELPVIAIYSSPMGRAQETAGFTAEKFDMPITVLHWAREVGLPGIVRDEQRPSPVAVWNLPPERLKACESHPDGWINAPELSPPKAEKVFDEIQGGWNSFLEGFGITEIDGQLVAQKELPKGDVLLFCHYGLGLALLSVILELPGTLLWRAFGLATTSVTTISFEQYKNTVNLRVTALGDTGHLLFPNTEEEDCDKT